ncbi:MAG: AsmA family protein [Gemmatimonadota bacterium]
MAASNSDTTIRLPSDGPDEHPSRRRRSLRHLGIAAAVLFTLFLAVTLVFAVRFRSLLDPETLAARLEPRLTQAANRPVTIDGASLRLWPRPGVEVEGIRVANRGIFSETALASAEAVILEPRLLPLLKREVVIDRILVRSPRLLLVVDENGTSNFGDFIPEPSEAEGRPVGDVGGISLEVRSLEITDGHAGYRDAQRDRSIQLSGLHLQTDLDFGGGKNVRSTGSAEAGEVTLGLPQFRERGIEIAEAAIGWDARLALDAGTLQIDRSEVRAGAFQADISGRIDSISQPVRFVDVAVRAEGLSLEDLIGPADSGLQPSGALEMDLRVSGPLGPGTTPEATGLVTLREGTLRTVADVALVSELDAEMEIRDGRGQVSAGGRLLDGDLALAGEVGIDSLMSYDLELQADADLAELLATIPATDAAPAGGTPPGSGSDRFSGRLAIDVGVSGHSGGGGDPGVEGMATITDLEARFEALSRPLVAERVPIRLSGQSASWREIDFAIGENRGRTTGVATRLFGDSGARDDRPVVDADVHFDRLALDALLPERNTEGVGWGRLVSARLGGRPIEGVSAEQLASERGQRRPAEPPIAGEIRVTIDQLRYDGHNVSDLDGTVRIGRQRIEIPGLTFAAYGGRGTASASLELGSAHVEPFGLRVDLADVRAEQWLSRQTPLGEFVSGTMGLELELAGGLDSLLLPEEVTLTGSGALRVVDGAIEPNPLTRAIASTIGAADPTGGRLQSWVSRFRIDDGAVHLADGRLEFPAGDLDLSGAVAFDGMLDLALRLRPDAATVRSIADRNLAALPPAAREALTAEGTPEFGLLVRGRLGDPQVTVDPATVRRAQDAIVEAGRSEIEKRGLDLLRRLTGQDSAAAVPPDGESEPR